ncbi:MAG: hypothetical protein SPL13_05560 [Clostridia bacterium]|nr:hypothetical protein [Clostridia bacterium]
MLKSYDKGFITLAFGKYYRKIAKNLLESYKIYNKNLPFAVITDKVDKFVNNFDFIIVDNPKSKVFFNKLFLNEYSPFDKTIFIDADVLVFTDISFYFDLFSDLNVPFSPLGRNFIISELENRVGYFDFAKTKKYNLKYTYIFNGGLYYFNRDAKNIFNSAQDIARLKYDYGFSFSGDEPCFALAMSIHNSLCLNNDKYGAKGMCWFPRANNFKINVKTGEISYSFGNTFNENETALVHFGTFNTYKPFYRSLVWIIKRKQNDFAFSAYKNKVIYFYFYIIYKVKSLFNFFIDFTKRCFLKLKKILKRGDNK